jgi:hypothetical protein
LLTTVQIAEMRNEPEITWRKRAQIGKIPGAFKVGNRWLLESRILQAMGMMEDVVNINSDDMWIHNEYKSEDAEQKTSVIDTQQK